MPKRNRSSKDRARLPWQFPRDHPIIVLVTICAVIATATFQVSERLLYKPLERENENLKREKEDLRKDTEVLKKEKEILERKSIETTTLNNNESYLDIREVCVPTTGNVEDTLKGYDDEKFYAPDYEACDSANNCEWKYYSMNQIDFLEEILGKNNEYLLLLRNIYFDFQSLNKTKVHIWKGAREVVLEGESPIKHLFPYIRVAVINNEKILDAARKQNESVIKKIEENQEFLKALQAYSVLGGLAEGKQITPYDYSIEIQKMKKLLIV